MKLLTKEIRERIPGLYATEHDKDPVVHVSPVATDRAVPLNRLSDRPFEFRAWGDWALPCSRQGSSV